MSTHTSQITTDHQKICEWAKERQGRPAAVKRTGGGDDPGIIRIDFPGYSGGDSLEEISWEDFQLQMSWRTARRGAPTVKLSSLHQPELAHRGRGAVRAAQGRRRP